MTGGRSPAHYEITAMFAAPLAVSLLLSPAIAAASPVVMATSDDKQWEHFKQKFNKHYKDKADEAARRSLFEVSKSRVSALNKINREHGMGDAFGVNWMSDRYPHEQYKKGFHRPTDFVPSAPVYAEAPQRSPQSVDWRLTEAVTPIKNQGQCGSCWAFSATEAVESQAILKSGGKADMTLAPQQIASCAPPTGQYGCQGCNGGFTEGAYEYLKTVPGLANGFYIPYGQSLTEQTQTLPCPTAKVQQMNGEMKQLTGGFAAVSGYHYAVKPCTGMCTGEHQDLKALAAALEKSPVSVCVNAGAWNDYTGGVMSAAACGPMGASSQDHCVMAVGFNAKAPTPYWIVRNSWASTWGEDGYIYLEMSKNTCGLANDVTVPEVSLDHMSFNQTEANVRREAMYVRATM